MSASDPITSGRRVSEENGQHIPEPRTSVPAVPADRHQASSAGSAPAVRVEELDTAQCWRLLETVTLGRLAVEGHDGRPDVFPVNYLVHNGNVFIRSAPGAKLRSIAEHPSVAFEIDGETTRYHWSVVIRGDAHRMDTDADIEASGIVGLVSSSPTPQHNFIRLTPNTVSGRRFPKRARPGTHSGRVPEPAPDGAPRVHLKPHPIPHFAPLPKD
jgi:uncharacterized protein